MRSGGGGGGGSAGYGGSSSGGGYGLIGDANRVALPAQESRAAPRRGGYALPTYPGEPAGLAVNSVLKGEVARIQTFGAFVRLQGQRRDGLVHISELSERRVEDVRDVVREGETVWIKVLSNEGGKISLSMASVDQESGADLDPSHARGERRRGGGGGGARGGGTGAYPVLYSIHKGSVARIAKFGAFITLAGLGRDGLCHLSALSQRRVESAEDAVGVGQNVYVKVTNIDETQGRIGLSIKAVDQSTGEDLDPLNRQCEERGGGGGGGGGGEDGKGGGARKRRSAPAIELGAVLNITCPRCGGKGHLRNECYASLSGTK